MSTSSNSKTTSVVQTGGQFSGSAVNARFKDTDYGANGLGDPQQLRKFFAQLNPIVQQVKTNGDTGVNAGNLDGDIVSYPIGAFQSDWTALTLTGGAVAGTTTIKCFDGTLAGLAVRKDPWGMVTLFISAAVLGAGTFGTLPQEFWPAANGTWGIPGGTVTITVSSAGAINASALSVAVPMYLSYPCATISPGTVPGVFPVYLKVAQGRTPVGVFLLGVKPAQSQDIYKTSTGTLGAPIGLAWTWLSGTAPDAQSGQRTNTIRVDNIPGLIPGINYIATFLTLYSLTGQSSGA